MFTGSHLLGWLALLLIIVCLSYSLLKRNKSIRVKRKTLLKYHGYFAILATAISAKGTFRLAHYSFL